MATADLRAWLAANAARLDLLVRQEVHRAGAGDLLEAALTAHLRLLLDGLTALCRRDLRAGLAHLADRLDREPLVALHAVQDERTRLEQALDLETRLLYGAAPADDPSLAAMVERRVRVGALVRAFLGLVETAHPSLDGLSAHVHAWLVENQRTLGVLTRQALERQVARYAGEAAEAAEQLATAALVQAQALVLALGLSTRQELLATG